MKMTKMMSTVAVIALMGSSAVWAAPDVVKDGWHDYASNTWVGESALGNVEPHTDLLIGMHNSAFGVYAGFETTVGYKNTFIGFTAGGENIDGNRNTYIGSSAGTNNQYGSENTFIGNLSGLYSMGSRNIFLGNMAGMTELGSNKLYISNSNTSSPLIYGEFDNELVRVNGTFETVLKADDTSNFHRLVTLDVNNTDGNADVGFSLKNSKSDFEWVFRTYNPGEGFSASKIGTGGNEFQVDNTGADLSTTVVKMGGVVVFKDGGLVDGTGAPLALTVQKQSILLAEMEAKDTAMEAALTAKDTEMIAMKAEAKTMKAEMEAGLKAKDTEMIAMKADYDTKLATQNVKIAQLKTMQQKVAMMESILTNLALNTSDTDKSKVSINLK